MVIYRRLPPKLRHYVCVRKRVVGYAAHPLLESEPVCSCFCSSLSNSVLGLRISGLWWKCFSKLGILWLWICHTLMMLNNSSFALTVKQPRKKPTEKYNSDFWQASLRDDLLATSSLFSFLFDCLRQSIKSKSSAEQRSCVLHGNCSTFTKAGLSTEGKKETKSQRKGNGSYHIQVKPSLKMWRKPRISLF